MRTVLLPYLDIRLRRSLLPRVKSHLREQGIRVVLGDSDLGPEDAEICDECLELPPYDQLASCLKTLRDYAGGHEVDAVLPQSEYGLLPAALLAREVGLTGIGPEAALLATDKWLSRLSLAAAGVSVPRFDLAEGPDQVKRFAREGRGYPLVLKPVASTLARNVSLARDEAEVEGAVRRLKSALPEAPDIRRLAEFARLSGQDPGCDPFAQFLVEEFVPGLALETDGLVATGAIHHFGITEQRLSPLPLFFLEAYLFPADLAEDRAARIFQASVKAVEACGIQEGAFSAEWRWDEGDPVLIELNGRLGEDAGFSEMFEKLLGRAPLLEWIEAAALSRPVRIKEARGAVALAYRNHYQRGLVREVAPLTLGPDLQVLVRPGSLIRSPGDPAFDPHLAWALASHPTSSRKALEKAETALEHLRLGIEPFPEMESLLADGDLQGELAESLRRGALGEKLSYLSPGSVAAWLRICRPDSPYRNFQRSMQALQALLPRLESALPPGPLEVVSLGAGQGDKDGILLRQLKASGRSVSYRPVDASEPLLKMAMEEGLRAGCDVKGLLADLGRRDPWEALHRGWKAPTRLFLLLGNTLGGFDPPQVLKEIRGVLGPTDSLLVDGEIYRPGSTEAGYDNPDNRAFAWGPLRDLGLEEGDGELVFQLAADEGEKGLWKLRKSFVPKRALRLEAGGGSVLWEARRPVALGYSCKFSREGFLALLEKHGGLDPVLEDSLGDGTFLMVLARPRP